MVRTSSSTERRSDPLPSLPSPERRSSAKLTKSWRENEVAVKEACRQKMRDDLKHFQMQRSVTRTKAAARIFGTPLSRLTRAGRVTRIS